MKPFTAGRPHSFTGSIKSHSKLMIPGPSGFNDILWRTGSFFKARLSYRSFSTINSQPSHSVALNWVKQSLRTGSRNEHVDSRLSVGLRHAFFTFLHVSVTGHFGFCRGTEFELIIDSLMLRRASRKREAPSVSLQKRRNLWVWTLLTSACRRERGRR